MKIRIMVLLYSIVVLFLIGCTHSTIDPTPSHPIPEVPASSDDKEHEDAVAEPDIFPVEMLDRSFETIYGWLDEQTILMSFEKDGSYYISSHNLFNNHSEIIFTSSDPIVNTIIHSNRKLLLVHTSPHTHGAKVFIINTQGNILYTTVIDSYEIAFEWYEKDASQLLITAFFEDWSFEVYHLNLDNQQLTEVPHMHPFMKWNVDKTVIEQKWKDDEISLFTSLWKTSLDGKGESKLLLNEIYRFDILSDYLMTIIVPKDNQEKFEYHFYNPITERKGILEMPNLTQFSDWLIPQYDYRPTNNSFITFVPKNHGSADLYHDGFKLIELDLNHFREKEILSNAENKPINCAPTGDLCLYGYQFEELLNLNSGERKSLVINNK